MDYREEILLNTVKIHIKKFYKIIEDSQYKKETIAENEMLHAIIGYKEFLKEREKDAKLLKKYNDLFKSIYKMKGQENTSEYKKLKLKKDNILFKLFQRNIKPRTYLEQLEE